MTDVRVIEIVSSAMLMGLKLAGPLLVASLVVGLVVAFLQTVTQIQEMSLTFVPKIAVAGVVLVVSGPWMIQQMVAWVQQLWQLIPTIG